MNDMRHTILVILTLILVSSCKTNDSCTEIGEGIDVEVKIELLHKNLFEAKSVDDVLLFLKANKDVAQQFFQIDAFPNDTVLANDIFRKISNPSIDTLLQEIDKKYGDFQLLKQEFQSAFKGIAKVYPSFNAPIIKTMVSGFSKDLYVSDSVIIIGLEYYLGEGATYRPLGVPAYILERYMSEYIVPSCVLLLSNKYNRADPNDQSLLADMMYFGKAYQFAKAVMPCVNDSLIFGYSGIEINDINENVEIVWAHFIANELLYETNYTLKNKYVGERPKTFEIGQKCPGRIGAWLGYDIVEQYVDETGVETPELMKISDAQSLFMQSKYKPYRR